MKSSHKKKQPQSKNKTTSKPTFEHEIVGQEQSQAKAEAIELWKTEIEALKQRKFQSREVLIAELLSIVKSKMGIQGSELDEKILWLLEEDPAFEDLIEKTLSSK